MRKPFPLIRSTPPDPDPAGGQPRFGASDLILLFVLVAALAAIAFKALG